MTQMQDQQATSSNEAGQRAEWHFEPELPIGNNPLFSFPWNWRAIASYHRDYWLTASEVSFFLILAVGGYHLHHHIIGDQSQLSFSWASQVYLRNLILVLFVAGGLHFTLYYLKTQNSAQKYVAAFGHKGKGRFTFGRQLYDNMFWSLASGVTIWSLYEIGLHHARATGAAPAITFAQSPLIFCAILAVTGMWIAFHFYWGHRFLHWGVMYKYVHGLHHRNVNVGPWSGISMHPIEHIIYFSSLLIHLVIPSHPIHVMFHGYMLALSAIIGHTGFHALLIKGSPRMALGHFHHQLHHRYFECNYGSVDFPLDVWFGSFHDGTKQARQALKSRLGPR